MVDQSVPSLSPTVLGVGLWYCPFSFFFLPEKKRPRKKKVELESKVKNLQDFTNKQLTKKLMAFFLI